MLDLSISSDSDGKICIIKIVFENFFYKSSFSFSFDNEIHSKIKSILLLLQDFISIKYDSKIQNKNKYS